MKQIKEIDKYKIESAERCERWVRTRWLRSATVVALHARVDCLGWPNAPSAQLRSCVYDVRSQQIFVHTAPHHLTLVLEALTAVPVEEARTEPRIDAYSALFRRIAAAAAPPALRALSFPARIAAIHLVEVKYGSSAVDTITEVHEQGELSRSTRLTKLFASDAVVDVLTKRLSRSVPIQA